ncbi:MAG TPA: hypothetical protein VFO18_15035 [Methylomirabilota bacterium]|nr:hypothetical protein [Methylomirabilota bacterium]
MTCRALIVGASILASTFGVSTTPAVEPNVMREALEAIALCVHWAGEEPYDEARRKDIARGIARACPEAQKKAARAHQRSPGDGRLAEPLLTLHDLGYFELSEEEKQRLCQKALPVFQKRFEDTKVSDPFVRLQCPEQAKALYRD